MKLKLLQSYLRKEKIEVVFLTHYDTNLNYFTKFKPSYGFLRINTKNAALYLTSLDGNPKIENIVVKKLDLNWVNKLKNSKIKRIGINKSQINVDFFEKLKKIYPKAKFVDIAEKLAKLRVIKDQIEINNIRQACKITDNAFNELLKSISKLKTESEVASFLESRMKEKGAELAFPVTVASGKNSAIPHHPTSNKKLGKGFLLLDFGAKYNGYCADMSRMLYLGKPSSEELKWYNSLLEIQEEAIKKISENKLFCELDEFVRKSLGMNSSYFIHSLGHGVGLDIHEAPRIAPGSKEKVLKNCVFTIEPGVYFPGKFGLRIEDTVLFDGKVKVLTKSSKELKIIKVR
tara:strand:- start:650 stop:1687 length:1038 start_codon:yes stop_codon:yes gene_type:complete